MMTTLEQELDRLTKSLGRLTENHSMKLTHKHVETVKVGDYLIYKVGDWEEDPDQEGRMRTVIRTHCRRVLATGGDQSSGSNPGYHLLALEGDPRIRKFNENANVVVLVQEESSVQQN